MQAGGGCLLLRVVLFHEHAELLRAGHVGRGRRRQPLVSMKHACGESSPCLYIHTRTLIHTYIANHARVDMLCTQRRIFARMSCRERRRMPHNNQNVCSYVHAHGHIHACTCLINCRERRRMEEENKKLRDRAKREFNEQVRVRTPLMHLVAVY